MSEYYIKAGLAAVLLAAGFGAFLSMMARFGRPGDEARSERLRRLHKRAGWAFVIVLAPLAVLGADFLVDMGEGLSTRGTFHFILAVGLVTIVLLKLLVVKADRQQLRFAPALGMTVFALTLIIFLITAGYFLLIKIAGH
jgi:cytochrome bd-type quinol oxidase subunit 2